MPSKLWKTGVGCTGILLVGLCIAALIEAKHALDRYNDLARKNGSSSWPQDASTWTQGNNELYYAPQHIIRGSLTATIATSSICLVATLLSLSIFFSPTTNIVAHALIAFPGICAPLIALIYSMAEYYENDRTWGYYDPQSTNGTYNVESWTCVMKTQLPILSGFDSKASGICKVSMAARWLTVPLFLVAAVFFVAELVGSRPPVAKSIKEHELESKTNDGGTAAAM